MSLRAPCSSPAARGPAALGRRRVLLRGAVVTVSAALCVLGLGGPTAQASQHHRTSPTTTTTSTTSTSTSTSTAASGAPQPVVSGNRLVDAATGQPIRIAGVNRSGSEYACVQGWGLFDGPVDDASVAAIAAWGTNAVRIPLNEDCWLGINGVKTEYGGTAYRSAIAGLVDRLHSHGLAAILDLHWAAPGSTPATSQQVAPDADHAPAFWSSVASTFKDDPSVMFELFNEPRDISWSCWRDGCTTPAGWKATGAQQLVDAVRQAGAAQPIIVDGLNWGGDLTGWVANAPTDPRQQLVAGWHIYNFSGCNTEACWNDTAAPVASKYPVLLTEVGEDDCATGFLGQILPWADSQHIGYLAWSWNTASCGAGPALISDYAGTPTAFGAGYKEHLAAPLASSPSGGTSGSTTDTTTGTSGGTTASTDPTTSTSGSTTASTTGSTTGSTDTTGTSGGATAQPSPAPLDPAALFDFEDGTTQAWATRWGSLGVTNETPTAVSGSHGLALTSTGAGYPAVGVDANLDRVTPGSAVTYRVWAPAGVGVSVSPMVYDQNWQVAVLPSRPLVAGWNTVAFTVPGTLGGVRVLGLQLNGPNGWTGTVDLDDITVATVRQGFEDGGAAGWATRWGNLPVWNDGVAYSGSHGLALGVSGAGYPAAGTDQVSGLTPGATVTMRVWAPSGVDVGVSPMTFDSDWHVTVLADQRLAAGWNTVTFTVPAAESGVRVVGLQVDDGSGWSGKLVVDNVSW